MQIASSAYLLLLLTLTQPTICQTYPLALTIVRTLAPHLSLSQFLQAIAQPQFDPALGMRMGYNLISLAGFTAGSSFEGLDGQMSPIMGWKRIYEVVMGGKPSPYGYNGRNIRGYVLGIFHGNKSKLMMNVDLSDAPVSGTNPVSASGLGAQISRTIRQLQLDGATIQFNDYNAVVQKSASAWLQQLLETIRSTLPQTFIILIIPPHFVTQMPLFRSPVLNQLVDFYVLKYYNTLRNDYTTYNTIFEQAAHYPQTAIVELLRTQGLTLDICRTMLAKPVGASSTWNPRQALDVASLSSVFGQAYTRLGWFGGFANLDYATDLDNSYVNAVLNNVRLQCRNTQTCHC